MSALGGPLLLSKRERKPKPQDGQTDDRECYNAGMTLVESVYKLSIGTVAKIFAVKAAEEEGNDCLLQTAQLAPL